MRYNFFSLVHIFPAVIVFFIALGVLACSDDELAVGSESQPSFSTDTLRLGTLLAETSSQTHQLMIYNHCDKELRLSSISLRDAETSGFRMNVDGMNGSSFTQSSLSQ